MNRVRRRSLVVVVALAAVSSACAREPPSPATETQTVRDAVTQLEAGVQSGVAERSYLVIRDATEFTRIYGLIHQHRPGPSAPPTPDLGNHVALFAFMGTQATTGYHIRFGDTATIADGVARVPIAETRPAPGTVVAQMTTAPYAIATLRRGAFDGLVLVDQAGASLGYYALR